MDATTSRKPGPQCQDMTISFHKVVRKTKLQTPCSSTVLTQCSAHTKWCFSAVLWSLETPTLLQSTKTITARRSNFYLSIFKPESGKRQFNILVVMAPTYPIIDGPPPIVAQDEESKIGLIAGLLTSFGVFLIVFICLFFSCSRDKIRPSGEKNNCSHSSSHRNLDHGSSHGHRHHSSLESSSTHHAGKDITRPPLLEPPLPVASTGTHTMRSTTHRSKSTATEYMPKPTNRSRSHSVNNNNEPLALVRGANSKARHRTFSEPQRPDSLAWPLPLKPIEPLTIVRVQLKPAPDHVPKPAAGRRDLRRTNNFHLTQSERGDGIRDDETVTSSDVSGISDAPSGICDLLRLLESDAPTAAKKHDSKPKLPIIDFDAFDGGLTAELDTEGTTEPWRG